MKTFCSHTLVKNGMPYIGLVLGQVAPFMDKCIVTISAKADEDTLHEVLAVARQHPHKFIILNENVDKVAKLTQERQRQVDLTTEDWVMFVDDDDYWPEQSITQMIDLINQSGDDVLAFANNPIQLVSSTMQDNGYRYRWFTKWFINRPGINWQNPWPEDNVYFNNQMLYWRKTKKVVRAPIKYFHLSYLKNQSFRQEAWAKKFKETVSTEVEVPEEFICDAAKLYDFTN